MARYNYVGNGCIDGSCLVKMASGGFKKVSELVKNDEVLTENEQSAKISCVIKTKCNNKK